MTNLINQLKYKLLHLLFSKGFFRGVSSHYGDKGLKWVYAYGFSITRKWREGESLGYPSTATL